jgi:hypothetical protein
LMSVLLARVPYISSSLPRGHGALGSPAYARCVSWSPGASPAVLACPYLGETSPSSALQFCGVSVLASHARRCAPSTVLRGRHAHRRPTQAQGCGTFPSVFF